METFVLKKTPTINSESGQSVRDALREEDYALADELAMDTETILRLTQLIFSQQDRTMPPS